MKAFPAPHPEIPPTPTTGWGKWQEPGMPNDDDDDDNVVTDHSYHSHSAY